MKKFINILSLTFMFTLLITSQPAYANELSKNNLNGSYASCSENDSMLINAKLLSSNSYIGNGRLITTDIYEQADGTIITDILNVSAATTYSKNGSDTATRTRTISGWGSITITASFSWYTEGMFSYVKCSSMDASYSMVSSAVKSTWETSYTSDYVSVGSASAQVKYSFYNKDFPAQYQNGTFKITCTDSGSISDNN